MEKNGRAEDLYFRGDLIHPNVKGHRAIGRAVAEFLSTQLKTISEKT
jgi:lysophospholipase L1-like esterase